jgi:pimeloyl-ACP methyl ester carboxylesterase
MPTKRDPPDIVFLVHGTYARGAPWCQPDSELSKALKNALPESKIIPFDWIGTNSHSARIDAGQKLADRIIAIGRKQPSAQFALVGHSHGGNVILYSLRDQNAAKRVRSAVFLGTPFFKFGATDLGATKHLLSRIFGAFVCIVSLIALVMITILIGWIIFQLLEWFYGNYHIQTIFDVILLSLLALIFVSIAGAAISHGPFFAARFAQLCFRRVFVSLTGSSARTLIARLIVPKLSVRGLIANSPRDEAYQFLRALAAAAATPYFLSSVLVACTRAIPIIILLLVVAQCNGNVLVGEQDAFMAGESDWLSVIGIAALFPAALFASASLLLIPIFFRGHRWAFGWMGILGAALVEVRPTAVPEATDEADIGILAIQDPRTRILTLVHSSYYSNPSVLSQITSFLNGSDIGKEHKPKIRSNFWSSRFPIHATTAIVVALSLVAMLRYEYRKHLEPSAEVLSSEELIVNGKPIATVNITGQELLPGESRTLRFDFKRLSNGSRCNIVGGYVSSGTQLAVMVRVMLPGILERRRVNSGLFEWENLRGERLAETVTKNGVMVPRGLKSPASPQQYDYVADQTVRYDYRISSDNFRRKSVHFERPLQTVNSGGVGGVLISNRGDRHPLTVSLHLDVICSESASPLRD